MDKVAVARRLKPLMARGLELAVGRRNLVRLARYLLDYARLDARTDVTSDGELMVQAVVLRHATGVGRIVVWDVGANYGQWSTELLRLADREHRAIDLHAFEPSRYTFQRLEPALSSVDSRHTVNLVQKGLSNADGTATLFTVHEGAGTNSLHDYEGWTDDSRVEQVEVRKADSYAAEMGIAKLCLLKCDAEGHDMAVLRGASSLLARGAIDVLQFEYNHRWIVAGHFLRDAFQLLQPLGYSLGKVTPRGVEFYETWDSELETFREANFLACTPAWRDRFPAVVWWNRSTVPSAGGRLG